MRVFSVLPPTSPNSSARVSQMSLLPCCTRLLPCCLAHVQGSPLQRYAEYAVAIRQEYSHLSDADYCAGRYAHKHTHWVHAGGADGV